MATIGRALRSRLQRRVSLVLVMSFVIAGCVGSGDDGRASDRWFAPVLDETPGSLAEVCEVGVCVAGVVLPAGAVVESTVDLEMPESLGALSVARVWTGQRSGIFGAGWESIWDVAVVDGALVGAVPARPLVAPGGVGRVPLADGSSLTFDDAGRVVEVCEPEAICTRADWSETRVVLSPAGSASERVELHLDGSRVTRAVSADGREVAYAYSGDRLFSASTPSGLHRYGHTDTGLLDMVETPLGTRRFTYDDAGSVTGLTDAYGGRWRFGSLGADGVVVERPDGTTRSYLFDAHRLIEASDSELGVLVEREYRDHVLVAERRPLDAVTIDLVDDGRLRVVTEAGIVPVTALYRFDDLGRVVEVESGGGVTTFVYDGFAITPASIETAAGIHRYEYDEHGLVVAMIDADGYRLEIDRAPNGLARHADDGLTRIEFDYDRAGRIVAETIGDATTRTDFDERGLVASTVTPSGVRTQYTHDEAGRLVAVDGPDPVEISYTDDGWLDEESMRLLGIGADPGSPAPLSAPVTRNADGSAEVVTESGATITADRWGRVTRIEADGTVAERDYDEAGRLIRDLGPDGAFAFTHTPAGRVASIETDGVRIDLEWAGDLLISAAMSTGSVYRFDYDRAGRVTAAHHGPLRWDYAYDLDGNLTEVHTPAGAISARWDESGRPVASTSGPGASGSGDGRVFDWDRRGRLVAVEHAGGERTEIDYDADGRVLALRGGDGEQRFDYDDLGRVIAAETDAGRFEWTHGDDGVSSVSADDRMEVWSHRNGQLDTITVDGTDHALQWAAPGVLASVVAEGEVLALGRFDGAGRLLSTAGPDGETTATFEWSRFGISSAVIDGDEFRIGRNLEGQVTAVETADGLSAAVDYLDGVPVAVRAGDTAVTFAYADGRLAESTVRTDDGDVTLVWAPDGASLERFVSAAGSGAFSYVDGVVDVVTVGDERAEVRLSDSVASAPGAAGQLLDDLFDDLGVFIGPMTALDTAPRAPLIDLVPSEVRPVWPAPMTADAVVDAALAAAVPDLALPLAPQRESGWAEQMIATAIGIGATIDVVVGPAQHVSVLLQPTGTDLAGVLAASSSVRSAESVLERFGGGSCLLCGITDFGAGVLSAVGSAATGLYRFIVDNPILRTVTSFAFVATAFVTSLFCGGVACMAGVLAGSVLLAQFLTSDGTGIAQRTFDTFAAPVRSLVSGTRSLDALAVASGAAVIAAAITSRRLSSSPVSSRALQRACGSDRVACLSYSRYPGAAGNVLAAQRAGVGRIARVNRIGADERSRSYRATVPVRAGLDRDEFPMAMMRASNRRVVTSYIPPADNRGAGAVLARQLAPLGTGQPFVTLVVP